MKRFIKTLLHNLLLAFLAFVWLVPIVWLVVTSFSAYTGMNTSTFFPKEWSLAQYKNLLFSADSVAQFPNWFKNTFIIACVVCVISTAFVLMVAYATSCMRFPARKPLMNAAVIVNLFPGVLSMIAVYFILKTLNLTNTHLGLILVYSAGAGLGYLIAKGFFDTIPNSLREAAYLDGGYDLLEGCYPHEPSHHCIYRYQLLPVPLDGFRICKADVKCRHIFPVDCCYRSVQYAG